MRIFRATIALGAAGVLLLGACSPTPQAEAPTPAVSPTTGKPTGQPTEETPEPFTPPQWPVVAATSADGIPGLDTLAVTDNDAHISVFVPQLQGHEKFNEFFSGWAQDLVGEFTEEYFPGGSGGADATDAIALPWLTATWGVSAVGEDLIGITLATTWSPGASIGEEHRVMWYDPEAGTFLSWQDFLTPESFRVLPELVVDKLKRASEGISSGDIDVEVLTALFDGDGLAVGFDPFGSLVITFDAYSILAGSYGSPAVAFSIAESTPWLTALGSAARDATMEPDVGAVPETPHVPEAVAVDCEANACVALTFDDGPGGSTTPRLLEILEQEQVVATFFMLGSQAKAFPGVVAAVAEAGHEVASHTWNHPSLPSLGQAGAQEQLARTNKTLSQITGSEVTLMRPPYGATNEEVAAAAKAEGLAQILWNIDTRDWEHHKPAKTIAEAKAAKPGSIILMHDIHRETVDAVPGVIKVLREKGYVFVTVSNLLGETTPGKKYFSR